MAVKPDGGRTEENLRTPEAETPESLDLEKSEAVGRGWRVSAGPPRLRRRKLPAPPARPVPGGLHTLDARLKQLSSLPSLKKAAAGQSACELVDASAPPPPRPKPEVEPRPGTPIDRGMPIPDNYGLDRLVAMVRDPHWVVLYWELNGGVLERLRAQHSADALRKARWVLRVQAIGELACHYVDVQLNAGNWHLKVAPNTSFRIDLGFVTQGGGFALALRGNEVRTPNCAVSDVVDERWSILRGDLERLMATTGLEVAREQAAQQPRALELFSSYMGQSERHAEKK